MRRGWCSWCEATGPTEALTDNWGFPAEAVAKMVARMRAEYFMIGVEKVGCWDCEDED